MAGTAAPAAVATTTTERDPTSRARTQLPAVRDYEQVDRDIIRRCAPTLGWFALLGVAIALLIGASRLDLPDLRGPRRRRLQPAGDVGRLHHHLRVLGRYRPRGTLISAILYLFRAGFRTTIYRCAEAMTVFAVMTAGAVPDHPPRAPWKFYWLIPYPNWRLHLAELQEPAGVGRVRDLDVPHGLDRRSSTSA